MLKYHEFTIDKVARNFLRKKLNNKNEDSYQEVCEFDQIPSSLKDSNLSYDKYEPCDLLDLFSTCFA
jgi:hypothetical protein